MNALSKTYHSLSRGAALLAGLVLAAYGFSALGNACRKVSGVPVGEEISFLASLNGFMSFIGLFWLVFGLFLLNAAWAGFGSYGPLDRVLRLNRRFAGFLPRALAAVCVALLLWGSAHLRFHTDAEAAASVFSGQGETIGRISNTGDLLFSEAADGHIHVARINPALYRQLKKRQISVGEHHVPELPMPGVLPILMLLLYPLFGLLKPYFPGAVGRWPKASILYFAVVHFYVIAWLISSQLFPFEGGGHSDALVVLRSAGIVAILFTVLTSIMLYKSLKPDFPIETRLGYMSFYFALNLGCLSGVYFVSPKTPGTPVYIWLLAYLTAGSFFWGASVAPPEEAAA